MKNKGFTLTEILTGIIVISVLFTLGTYAVVKVVDNSRNKALDKTAVTVQDAAEMYIVKPGTKLDEGITVLDMTPGIGEHKGLLDLKKDPWGKEYKYVLAVITKNGKDIDIKVYMGLEKGDNDEFYVLSNDSKKLTEDTELLGQTYNPNDPNSGPLAIPKMGGLIPVVYNNSNWVKANINNPSNSWYDYANKKWANAVSVTTSSRSSYNSASVGTVINENHILAHFVWIPRYEYKLTSLSAPGSANPGAIEINFLGIKQTTATSGFTIHDAFNFGGQNISGFWYGKFETSADPVASENCYKSAWSSVGPGYLENSGPNCNNGNVVPRIKPNRGALTYQDVRYKFETALKFTGRTMTGSGTPFTVSSSSTNEFGLNGDSHVSKNNEWGAVAYLSQSIYGRCSNSTTCTEMHANPYFGKYFDPDDSLDKNDPTNPTGITGCGGSDIDGISKGDGFLPGDFYYQPYGGWTTITFSFKACVNDDALTSVDTYDTANGQSASTTGNIYGIYDMKGGSREIVMGNYSTSTTAMVEDSGTWAGFSSAFYPPSKYMDYYTTLTGVNLGHALSETTGWYGEENFDLDYQSGYTWVARDGWGSFLYPGNSGMFKYDGTDGTYSQPDSFRVTFIP